MKTAVYLEHKRKCGEEQVAVGVDPSRFALQLAILAPHSTSEKRIPLTPASLRSIDGLLDARQVRIGIEGSFTCGALVLLHWLRQGYDVREVNPQVSKRLRECLTEAHTDRSDAKGLAWSVRVHPHLSKVCLTPKTAAWKRLAGARDRLVKTRTALYNRLHASLAESYGGLYKALFKDLTTKKALSFFREFPTLNDAVAGLAHVQELAGEGKATVVKEAGIWEEGPCLNALRIEVRLLINLLFVYREAVDELERRMEELSRSDPAVGQLLTISGIGTVTALTILGYSGDFSRFASKDAYTAYCGLAPTIRQSGQGRARAKPRQRYKRVLKAAFMQLALTRLRENPESRAYYDREREEGKSHWAALRALARQLAKVVYRMMTEETPYARART